MPSSEHALRHDKQHTLQTSIFSRSRPALAIIALISLPLLFLYLGSWNFIDPDEGRYGTIPFEMLTSGDFVTPTQNFLKFFDKPPLLYWAVAASYRVFGFGEGAARLVPALAALAGLFGAFALGRRMFGTRAGLFGALVLGTTVMWPIMGRIVVTDMLVSSLIFLALTLWWLAHSEPESGRQRAYFLAFWAILALGVLAKGPMAVLMTGGSIFLYLLFCRQWRALRQMQWGLGLPLFALIAAPWFVLVAQRNPGFNHFFWYDQHIGRFLGKTTGNDHVQGPFFYILLLPVACFPWSLFFPAALLAAWHNRSRLQTPRGRALVFLMCGAGFVVGFFSISSGKLLTYILPSLPMLALLMAAYLDRLCDRPAMWSRVQSAGVALLCLFLVALGVGALVLAPRKLTSLGVGTGPVLVAGAMILLWAVVLAWSGRRFGPPGLVAATAGGFALVFGAVLLVIASVAPLFTTAPLIASIRPGLRPQTQLLTVGYVQSLRFYTGRRVKIFGPPDETSYGVSQLPPAERRQWVYEGKDEAGAIQRDMASSTPVYCFLRNSRNRKKTQTLMNTLSGAATLITRNERFVVIGNRAALRLTPPHPERKNDWSGPATLMESLVGVKR